MKAIFRLIALVLLLATAGCGKARTELVEVEGTVTLDGKPLPRAQVNFIHDRTDIGPEWSSSAVTDDQGNYQLICNANQKPGAVLARHRVLVTDPPPPAGLHGREQRQYEAEMAHLPNRPIPVIYSIPAQTPLGVEVTADSKKHDLVLVRKAR